MGAVTTSGLVKTYAKKRAIDGLSVDIAENRITGLIGRNGAGKTTLLKLIAGYYRPTKGDVRVFGKKPFNSIDVSSSMIYVDDNMTFPQSLCLVDIIVEMSRFYCNFDTTLAHKLLEYFLIDGSQKTAKLSKGTRSTFYAILGVAARAPLSIFDEPTTGMDAAVRKDFYRLLLKEYIAFPRSVIISSHQLGEMTGLLEDIVLIDNGRLVEMLSADEADTCAIGIRGGEQAVSQFIGDREIVYRESFAPGIVFNVVKTPMTKESAFRARELSLELQPVKLDELCTYLTQNGRGGIDDALRRE